jgi:SAM-dependent methyltransferase
MSTDATGNFTGRADGYARYRPDYPEDYVDYLKKATGLAEGHAVADVGSGTGILSAQLLARGLKVFAVEPNADMRETAERRLGAEPAIVSVCGKAENTTLEEGSVGLVTAAQAFHWFDRDGFGKECRRILMPGAKVALVWNSRELGSPVVQENDEIIRKYCHGFLGFGGGTAGSPEAVVSFFRSGTCECRTFRNDVRYSLEAFLGRNLSGSYSPFEGDENYAGYVDELTKLFRKYSESGILVLPQVTESYLGYV